MSLSNPEGQDTDPAFPEIVDDADPADDRLAEPQIPALPGDDYLGATARGTTVEEEIEGESLDDKLAREVPDPTAEVTLDGDGPVPPADLEGDGSDVDLDAEDSRLAGRLVEPDEGVHEDTEATMVAGETLSPGMSATTYDASPEELAMHIEPEG